MGPASDGGALPLHLVDDRAAQKCLFGALFKRRCLGRPAPVVEADGRAPIERQSVAQIAGEVPPDTDARLAEEPVEDRRQRVELIREPGDALLQLVRRHVAWSKDSVDLAVVAVPIRRQQASGTYHLVEEPRAGHRHDDAYGCAVDADPSIES